MRRRRRDRGPDGRGRRRRRSASSSPTRSASRTGRSTSTSTRRRRSARRSRTSRRRPASRSSYIEDINDNEEFFGKYPGPARRRASRSTATSSSSPTGWPPAWFGSATSRSSTSSAIPNAKNLVERCSSPGWDPEPRVHTALAVRHDRASATTPKVTAARSRRRRSCSTTRSSRARSRCLSEMADTMGLVMQAQRRRPDEGRPRPPSTRRSSRLQEAVDSGQIRQFTGNDYSRPARRAATLGVHGVVGRHDPAAGRQPEAEVGHARAGGMIWTDNMLIPTGGDVYTASTFMDFVYDPKIAAQIEAYVNYICPVEGAKEEMTKLDPEIANEPADLPDEETLSNVKIFDADALNNEDYKKKFAGGRRRLGRMTFLHRHRWADAVPAARCRAGVPGAVLRRPARTTWRTRRCRRASLELGYAFDWAWANYKDAISTVPHAVPPLAPVRGDRDAGRARHQLPARVLHRVPRRALEEPAAAPGHRAVLRHVPDPHARVADDPRRRGLRRGRSAQTRICWARTAGCSPRRPRSSRASPTTSCRSWCSRST